MTILFRPPPGNLPAGFPQEWMRWFTELWQLINGAQGGGGVTFGHNAMAGLQGGTSGQYYHLTAAEYALVHSSAQTTYTPILTKVANLDAVTAYACQYMRFANSVLVSGRLDADPTAGLSTKVGISFPVASVITDSFQCAGTASCPTIAGQSAAILGDVANGRAQMEWIAVDVTNQPMDFIFMYSVL